MQPKTRTEVETHPTFQVVETRASDSGSITVAGYAAVFDEVTTIGDCFEEVVAPGAFARSLKESDVLAFLDHDSGRVLGRKSSGTLRLREDEKGLAVEIDLPDTTDGRDAKALIERGDISGMSFGFWIKGYEWDESGDLPRRTILDVELIEVSIVSMPQYQGTSIALRSLDVFREKARSEKNFMAVRRRLAMKIDLDQRVRR